MLGDGQGAQDQRGQDRDGRNRTAHLLQEQEQLHEAEPTAPGVLGHADPEKVGSGQLGPESPVDVLGAGLDLLQALLGDVALQDLLGQVTDGFLLVVEGEVHRCSYRDLGRPRPNMAISSRWISLVPPPKVRMSSPR